MNKYLNTLRARNPQDIADRIQWLNSSGEEVPPFGVVKLFSHDTETEQYQADKPNGSAGPYFVNGPAAIGSNGYSASGMWNFPRRCLLDETSYGVGDTVGPVENEWHMSSEGTGWVVLRPPDENKHAVVMMIGAGGPGGAANIFMGIINESLGRGYYTVEIAGWGGTTPKCDVSNSPVASLQEEREQCNPCEQLTGLSEGSLDDNCGEITLPEFRPQHVGLASKAYVLAYHPGSTIVPLEVGTDCVMADLGASNPVDDASGSGVSGSSMEEEPVYHILSGHQSHTVQYVDTYGCCGTGEDVLISRKAIIFAALECDVAVCDPCEQTGGGPS